MAKLGYEEYKQKEREVLQKFNEPDFVILNNQTKRRTPLVHKQTIIGRNINLLLHLDDISVSQKHAILEHNDEFTRVYLVDLGAKNGCYVNG
jgi:pSer/pThr/pTyr-binding forkhead associated (FHA) protein